MSFFSCWRPLEEGRYDWRGRACPREVRRGTRPVSSLSEPASCERIVFGIISHLNRCCSEKPLQQFSRNELRSAEKRR
jgi:hypothetical protein